MNSFNDSILNTVYWALGTVGAFVLLLFGFNWYSSYRMYDRDKKAFQQEITAAIQAQTTTLHTELQTLIEKRVAETVKLEFSTSLAGLTMKLDSLRSEILEFRFRILKSDERYWTQEKIHMNVVSHATERLQLAKDVKNDYEIGDSLAKISDALTKQPRVPMYSAQKFHLASLLDNLPTKFASEIETIKSVLKDIKTT